MYFHVGAENGEETSVEGKKVQLRTGNAGNRFHQDGSIRLCVEALVEDFHRYLRSKKAQSIHPQNHKHTATDIHEGTRVCTYRFKIQKDRRVGDS